LKKELYVKKPWLAFLLSFLVAGAGFAYLGKWTWAILNFSAAIAVGLVVYRFSPDSLSIASTAVAAASGSLAMAAAKTMNTKFIQQSAPSPLSR
jgi:ABC-type polysaccharide/polyol phosphate export permease